MADELERGDKGDRSRARQLTGLALAGLAVLFAVVNFDEVSVNWVITTSDTPLIIVILVSLVIGAGLGFLIGRRGRSA